MKKFVLLVFTCIVFVTFAWGMDDNNKKRKKNSSNWYHQPKRRRLDFENNFIRAARCGDLPWLKSIYILQDFNRPVLEKALIEAIKTGHLHVVIYLIDEIGVDCFGTDNFGYTFLHTAAFSGKMSIIRYLVEEKNVDPNTMTESGVTPLHDAASAGCFDIVSYFVGNKLVSPFVEDNYGNTPSSLAKRNGHTHIVLYLENVVSLYQEFRDVLLEMQQSLDGIIERRQQLTEKKDDNT